MPVSYSYNSNLHAIEVVCTGKLTLEEITQYFVDLERDASMPSHAIEVVDLDGLEEFDLSSKAASRMPEAYERVNVEKAIAATILIGTKDVNYGIGRMIQTYFDSFMPQHTFEIVRSKEEAHALLARLRHDAGHR